MTSAATGTGDFPEQCGAGWHCAAPSIGPVRMRKHLSLRVQEGKEFPNPLVLAADGKLRDLKMAPEVGLEPTTTRLTAACSTIELLWNANGRAIYKWTSVSSNSFFRSVPSRRAIHSLYRRLGSVFVTPNRQTRWLALAMSRWKNGSRFVRSALAEPACRALERRNPDHSVSPIKLRGETRCLMEGSPIPVGRGRTKRGVDCIASSRCAR